MDPRGQAILHDLATVEQLRAERAADRAFGARVQSVKLYQQSRFEATYRDLLTSPRYAQAARFFLDELYGPADFSSRDKQFARVVPSLVRMFPDDVVSTVGTLGRLHALSEELDSAMARHVPTTDAGALDDLGYQQAWVAVGRPQDRQNQIDLTLQVGRCLDRYTRNPILRTSLHMMRGAARLAGLGQLQGFLESGFDTFAAMRGSGEFLEIVRVREQSFAASLFGATK